MFGIGVILNERQIKNNNKIKKYDQKPRNRGNVMQRAIVWIKAKQLFPLSLFFYPLKTQLLI